MVTYGPYTPFEKDQFILRDRLAMDRTTLANERTLLAYLRTSLTIVIVAVTFLKFLDSLLADVLGWAMLPIAVIIAIIGIVRYNRRQRMITMFKAISPTTETPAEVEAKIAESVAETESDAKG
jgi:putative membrane protein